MEVKKTLLMPKTRFEMRGNLAVKEPLLAAAWRQDGYYEAMRARRRGAEEFQLHDGPPYANGDMHTGHMLNRFLKDIVLRYKNMRGYDTPFTPGWDTHGLPIENYLTKKGVNRKQMTTSAFREACRKFALEQVARQKEQILRLGVVGDFDHPYVTLDPSYEARQIGVFASMALQGLIYKGLKPVYWSWSSESALAEAEIEYEDVTSESIYVAFKVTKPQGPLCLGDRIVIWTTTPWTLPGNLAIAAHPEFEYGRYQTEHGVMVFLKDRAAALREALHLSQCELIEPFKGKALEYAETAHPFLPRTSLLILGDHVTSDTGTGFVHTAPGHGEEDFAVGKLYDLPPLCPVDARGLMTAEAGVELEGLFYEAANEKILGLLTEGGALLGRETITHSYPHDWRTGKPLIYRATPQWFCSIEPIRKKLLSEIERVNWTPSWGRLRIHNMIKDRGDWCISRQRVWGVPIPIIYNEDGSPIIEPAVFEHIQTLIKDNGSNVWFEREPKDLLPAGYHNMRSPRGGFYKETDIMDVWFDSGSSSISVLTEREQKWPADLYLEGSDQYRGWFNSSLIIAVATRGQAPYDQVVSHGFVVDGKGEKMSKSKGNGIDPLKMCQVYGADILRLWAATVDYQADVRASEDIFKGNAESYRKIRNTVKFMLGNLANGENGYFDPVKDDQKELSVIDQMVLEASQRLVNKVAEAMDAYDFAGAMMNIQNFVSSDLSSFYCDITKDILYCEAAHSPRRLQVQTTYYRLLKTILGLLTPILPFTMEEAYAELPGGKHRYAQLEDYPSIRGLNDKLLQEYDAFLELRSAVLKKLETARAGGLFGSAQEAKLTLGLVNDPLTEWLFGVTPLERARYFIVSEAVLTHSPTLEVTVTRHQGYKCDRCWNYYDRLESVAEVQLCPRCHEAVKP
ncbi:MAG: isoleucine--tRNA ligase [Bacilli bacterium]|jgi:isoleucyl-tRNA synthetase